jgi:hypothetical protein
MLEEENADVLFYADMILKAEREEEIRIMIQDLERYLYRTELSLKAKKKQLNLKEKKKR